MNMWSVHDKTESRDGWSLPPGMADMVDAPLYLAVSVWGLRQARIITTEDISAAVFVSPGGEPATSCIILPTKGGGG